MGTCRLNLRAIEKSLRAVQREFPKINAVLRSRRDSMSDEVVDNMMAGYALVDKVLANDTDIVTAKRAAYLLELNHTVLCGLDPKARKEHQRHVEATIKRFYTQKEFNIENILRWYREHNSE